MAGETYKNGLEAIERRIADSPFHQVGFNLPRSLDEKVKGFVALAAQEGDRTSRTEMFSAIIFHAEIEPDKMGEFLRSYRLATIADLQRTPDEP